jgi:hypothetical protein
MRGNLLRYKTSSFPEGEGMENSKETIADQVTLFIAKGLCWSFFLFALGCAIYLAYKFFQWLPSHDSWW